ncbi:4Fe-4S binding protein [Actibacterium sp. 188UL27-1]|uniref:4Fe-4S binding protein n=1 Tax=Actibacterium sp. 188UL27-1 TaxID=2786961 RepID=UPI0019594EF7|nr:4Fe-4S binding protein [Actibacterium sp. 188UL27-1]MBM7066961.1 4Fe-4S binding protein [Actibacterium sp. 188UL27-1]
MVKIARAVLCNCAGSQQVDAESAALALPGAEVSTCEAACMGDLDVAERSLAADGTTLIACGQMADLFVEMAGDTPVVTADIRDRAGWTADGAAFAKQAALLAEAAMDVPAIPVKDIVSEGVTLVLGEGDVALAAAARLGESLPVTCILAKPPSDVLPPEGFDLITGRLRQASGTLGRFKVMIDGFAPLVPAGRGALGFAVPRDGAASDCDVIVDLRGGTPLFPTPEKRDGYLRADPGDPLAVERLIRAATDLVGTFEKPLHIRFDPHICAHSRASQQGCDRCLTVCPTGAILPAGDHVAIDPDICAGCGACAAVCPSGAASYDTPPVAHLFNRLRTLASAYRNAGGAAPRALFHDADHGGEMFRLSARLGRGLPADVIPVEVENTEMVGHSELLAALGVGFAEALVLAGPRADQGVIAEQISLANALSADQPGRIGLLASEDPDALEEALYGTGPGALTSDPVLPLGSRREVARLTATALATDADSVLPLPAGAPYGAVVIDKEACTLCLACVSLCPVGALGDNPDAPQVNFQESACLQCGICASTCPETAITLAPQMQLGKAALERRILHEEEPFACVECGKLFGVKSTIEKIAEKLDGKHWMFQGSDNIRLIQMCDDCRVNAQYHQKDSPFRGADRPPIRTADDPGKLN